MKTTVVFAKILRGQDDINDREVSQVSGKEIRDNRVILQIRHPRTLLVEMLRAIRSGQQNDGN